jgi:hypothetical protein
MQVPGLTPDKWRKALESFSERILHDGSTQPETEELLAKLIVGMTISLGGFVAEQNGDAEQDRLATAANKFAKQKGGPG